MLIYGFEENIFKRIHKTLNVITSQEKFLCINSKVCEEVHGFQNSFSRYVNKNFEDCDSRAKFVGSLPLWLSPSGIVPVSCLL